MKTVALFCDTHMLPGLHATLASLHDSMSSDIASDITVYVFLDGVREREKEWIESTHRSHTKGANLRLSDYSPSAPPGGNSLHGNQTTYGRLALHELIPDAEHCIYLDSDLLVNRCVGQLFDEFDGKHVLLADGTHDRRKALENDLFAKAGLDMDGKCFNAGILGIDLGLWRSRGVSALCEQTARDYSGMFRSADQAMLNVALHDSFKPVGNRWNTPLYPTNPAVTQPEERIYHFVGSPKPWDFMARRISNHYSLWHDVYTKTAIGDRTPLKYASLKRTLLTSGSMYRAWRAKRKSGR